MSIFPRQAKQRSAPATLRHAAEESAAAMPPLQVAAERIAATVAQGVHGRRRVGQGDSFWQFRRHQPGDSVQAIDWRQTAKTQHTFVRENEWEAAQSAWIWCDTSESMWYRSSADMPEKAERAAVLSLALASLLVRAGERIALAGTGERPTTGRAALNRMADRLLDFSQSSGSLPVIEPLPRYASMVVISDFLSPPADIEPVIRHFASSGVRGHMVQILDPAEERLPFRGRVLFEGMEHEGAALIGRVEHVREDYATLMNNHRDALAELARSVGWSFATHHTDRPPQTALLALFGALSGAIVR